MNKHLIEEAAKKYQISKEKGFVGDFELSFDYLNYAFKAGAEFALSLPPKDIKKLRKESNNEAVEFAEWIVKKSFKGNYGVWESPVSKGLLTTQDLYQIFKTK